MQPCIAATLCNPKLPFRTVFTLLLHSARMWHRKALSKPVQIASGTANVQAGTFPKNWTRQGPVSH